MPNEYTNEEIAVPSLALRSARNENAKIIDFCSDDEPIKATLTNDNKALEKLYREINGFEMGEYKEE